MNAHANTRDLTAQRRDAGVGHASNGWRCPDCGHMKVTFTGRKWLLIQGCKQWVCAACVTKRSSK